MTLHTGRVGHSPNSTDTVFPEAFRPWRAQLMRDEAPPIIAVAGSRGKSTVSGLLAAIFDQAALIWATKSISGVTVRGVSQAGGEAWDRVKRGLEENVFDIAIEELEWPEVAAVSAGETRYAITAVTNVCANRDECLIQDESRVAVASLPNLVDATAATGALVLNCEDVSVIGPALDHERTTIFVGQNGDNPALQFHLESGGIGAWRDAAAEAGELRCGVLGNSAAFGDPADFEFMLRGAAAFQITNALTAIAAAASCGIPANVIRRALADYAPCLNRPVAIFHATEVHGVRIVIDRPNPSWHLRQVVRAVRDAKAPRVITILGRLDSAPSDDLVEVGRLLGRLSSILVVHSSAVDEERVNLLRHGIAQNAAPPVIVHTQSEQRALAVAMERARRGDLVFVLADDPALIHREIEIANVGVAQGLHEQQRNLAGSAL